MVDAYTGVGRGDEGGVVGDMAWFPKAKGEARDQVGQASTGGLDLGKEGRRIVAKRENKLRFPGPRPIRRPIFL